MWLTMNSLLELWDSDHAAKWLYISESWVWYGNRRLGEYEPTSFTVARMSIVVITAIARDT
jgi:hypothetical protein